MEKKKAQRRPFWLLKPAGTNDSGEVLYTATCFTKQSELLADLAAGGFDSTNVNQVRLFRAESLHGQLNLKTQTVFKFSKKEAPSEAPVAAEGV